jgi:hypothetical protein
MGMIPTQGWKNATKCRQIPVNAGKSLQSGGKTYIMYSGILDSGLSCLRGGGDKPLNYMADDFRSRNGFLRQGAYAWQGKPENRGYDSR